MSTDLGTPDVNQPTRRTVTRGVALTGLAVALCGCQTYGERSSSGQAAPQEAAPAATDTPAAPATGGGATAGGAPPLASTSEIPVGGGKVFSGQKIVVTQPAQGEFAAFNAVCTHQGCTVASVQGGTINCPCHGSKYRIADAAVVGGPAPRPLAKVEITVEGDAIRLA
jgi:Rieske Fe-S protein